MIPVNNVTGDSLASPIAKRKGSGHYYTSADYHDLYLSGEVTPTAIVETLLPLVRRDIQPAGKHSTAFVESQVEIIRAAAEASSERYKKGQPLGPLDGIPVAVKDEVHIKGYKRTLGTNLDFKAGSDATSWCVQQWLDAGAIVIGKSTMHELGLGMTTAEAKSSYLYQLLTKQIPITIIPTSAHLRTRITRATIVVARLVDLDMQLLQDWYQLH